jgi:hypothetical protein
MQVPVRVERVHENGFRAHTGEPFCLSAEWPTRDHVLSALHGQIESQIQAADEIVVLDIPADAHLFARFQGMYKENPLFDEWLEAMREYRRTVDESKVPAGQEMVLSDNVSSEYSLARFAGDMKADPLFDGWQEAIAEYQRSVDADQNSK